MKKVDEMVEKKVELWAVKSVGHSAWKLVDKRAEQTGGLLVGY